MLIVHRAPRADVLAAALAERLATPLPDPFTAEIVAVPTRGIERWLSQTLAARLGTGPDRVDGVCANVEFPFPGTIVNEALARATGVDPVTDPWRPERLVWPLMEVVEGALDDPGLAALAQHLGANDPRESPERRERRFASLRHVADLFDRYAIHRPEMLVAWAGGDDTDGTGGALPEDLRWQAALWRRLRDHLAAPSPAERLDDACARIAADPDLAALPERLSLFGLTRLPASYLAVLRAIARSREVHLFLLHPSPDLWRDVAGLELTPGPMRRADDPTATLPRNPLLASWGRDAREMQVVLATGADEDAPHPAPEPPLTLLGRLQNDIRENRAAPGSPVGDALDMRMVLGEDDRSLQVHACHGRTRQVEVVRDAILHLMAENPSLEPRDVLVMCPDVEDFAPLVAATFAGGGDLVVEEGDRPPDLRVRLADRSLRQTNPLLAVVASLLEMADSRVTRSHVLDLAGRPPVRRRFGFDDDDLARIEAWVGDAGVRWGLDGDGRAAFGLGGLTENTWAAGVDRLLVGVAVAEADGVLIDGVLPFDDVGSQSIDLVGRLTELVERLRIALGDLAAPHTPAAWASLLGRAADLLTAVHDRDAWQRRELDDLLSSIPEEAGGVATALSLREIRALLADRLRGRPTRANFRTGHLTVCTLVPMRSVPHRVVCVMGLDDGTFPRRGLGDGDDVLIRNPHVGDRDVRGEDRQLLLDALLAAGERLVIAHSGRDERTNAELPPAVPVLELLDAVDRTAVTPSGGSAAARITVHHPLQPFDARNFTPGGLGRPGPWGFDPTPFHGAVRRQRGAGPPAPFLAAPLAPPEPADLQLAELAAFVKNPVDAFLRQRLNVYLAKPGPEDTDGLLLDMSGLASWKVGDRLLRARAAGTPWEACVAAERARGGLPPGALADGALTGIATTVDALLAACPPAGEPENLQIDIHLGDGRLLLGTVAGVRGDVVTRLDYSSLKPSRRLEAWLHVLALTAHDPTRPWRSLLVQRSPDKKWTVAVARIPAIPGETPEERRSAALDGVMAVVDLFDRGMREPLPIFERTSHHLADPAGGRKRARTTWEDPFAHTLECDEPAHRLLHGGSLCFDDLLTEAPRADECGPGWPDDHDTRVERLAHRLWDGLLACERVEHL